MNKIIFFYAFGAGEWFSEAIYHGADGSTGYITGTLFIVAAAIMAEIRRANRE